MTRWWRLLLGTYLGAALAAAGCLTTKKAPTPIVDIPLAVRVHTNTALSLAEAKAIASRSSDILQTEDWNSDVACAAKLSIASRSEFSVGNGIVASSVDFDALFTGSILTPPSPSAGATTRQVRVVLQITWCGATIASAAGCADISGTRIVVARRGADREGELWAHEVGHTSGLPDRSDSWLAVMFPDILPDHKELNETECTAFRK